MSEMMLLGLLVVVSISMLIYALLPGNKEIRDHVIRRMAGKRSLPEQPLIKGQNKSSAATKMLEKVAPLAMKPVMPRSDAEMSTLREKLANAGYRHESATRYFLASKTIVGLTAAGIALVL